jgi:hypothetical protein
LRSATDAATVLGTEIALSIPPFSRIHDGALHDESESKTAAAEVGSWLSLLVLIGSIIGAAYMA